jgi:serine/threonine protein kinase
LPIAIDILDRLVVAIEPLALDVSGLLAIRPECIDVILNVATQEVEQLRFHPPSDAPAGPPYMAWPEYAADIISAQYTGSGVASQRAAVYCLGVLLHHMLADQPPFVGGDLVGLAMRHLSEQPPELPGSLRATSLARVLTKCLAKRTDERFNSLRHLREALQSARPRPAQSTDRAFLVCDDTGTRFDLRKVGARRNDSLEIRVGRADPLTHLVVDIDMRHEPSGRCVHRRQAIIRRSATYEWSIEDWVDPSYPRSAPGMETAVNGRTLRRGEPFQLDNGDRVWLGPVATTFEILPSEQRAPRDEDKTQLDLPVGPSVGRAAIAREADPFVRAASRW